MPSLTKEFLIKEYLSNRRSFADIAKQLGTYPNKIRRAAISMGITPRDKSVAQKQALKSGRHGHPTKGRGHSHVTKEKISDTTYSNWESMDEKERNRRSDIGKEQWENKTEEEKNKFYKLSGEAIRKASVEGSKLEKYLLKALTNSGFRVDFHREHMLLNERLQVDLFLPELSAVIEVDGPSHFKPVWGEEALERSQKSDRQKTGLILSSGLILIRIRQAKALSNKYKRIILSQLLEVLEGIKHQYPAQEERYIEINGE